MKRPRGRPRKARPVAKAAPGGGLILAWTAEPKPKRPRGRPRGAKTKPDLWSVFREFIDDPVGLRKFARNVLDDPVGLRKFARELAAPRYLQRIAAREKHVALAAAVHDLHRRQGLRLDAAIDAVAREGVRCGDDTYQASPATVRRAWQTFGNSDFSGWIFLEFPTKKS